MPARPRKAIFIALLAVIGLGCISLLVTAPSTSADEAVDSFTQLPLSHIGEVLIDDVQGQTFVSGGRSGEGIAVAAHDGSPAQMLPDTQGATEMAPSTDEHTVYATVHGASEIVAVDTASLRTTRIDTGDLCVSDLAATPGTLWFAGESCPDPSGWQSLYRLDLASGSVSRIGEQSWTWNDPILATIPGSDHFLVAQTGTTGDRVVEMSDAGQEVASAEFSFVDDLEVLGNGEIGVALGGGFKNVRWLRIGDLVTTSSGSPGSNDWTSDRFAIGEAGFAGWQDRRVAYLDDTGAPTKILALGPQMDDPVAQVELRGTTLYAVTHGARLYRVNNATLDVPDLTISGPPLVERGEPVHLSGSLFDGPNPIAGQVVTIRDNNVGVLGEATTDSAGDWAFDLTATGEGLTIWVASVPASGDQRAVSADLRSGVTDPTPLLEVTAPDRVSPDQRITVSGRVTHDGEPVAERGLSLYEICDGRAQEQRVGDSTTATDGTFSFDWDPGDCDFYEYRVIAWRDADWLRTEAEGVVVLDWRRPTIDVTADPSGPAGSPLEITATLTDQNQPMAGESVRVWFGLNPLGRFTTDAAGEVNVTSPAASAGRIDVSAQYDGDSVSRPTFKRIYVEIDRLPSTLTLSAPETIREGDEVVLTGVLGSDGAQSLEGLPVHIERTTLYSSPTELGEATTDTNGAFTFTDPQPVGGQAVYTASFTHQNFEPSTADATVIGATSDPVVTVESDRSLYTVGDIAHIRVGLETDAPRPVVVMSRSGGSTIELWHGDLQGAKELEFETRNTSHISVHVYETDWSTYQVARTTLPVRLLIATQARGGYDTVNGFRLYRPAADPVFATTVEPPRFGLCVRHQVQKRISGVWTLVRTSPCVQVDIAGQAQWSLSGDQARQTAFRTRAVFVGDRFNAATNGPWAKFKFV